MSKKLLIMGAMLAFLTACGGGGDASLGTGTPSDGGGTGGGGGGTGGGGTGGGTTQTISFGTGVGGSFQAGAIGVSGVPVGGSLSAGGNASLQVSLVDQTGTPYLQGSTVTFSSACISQGTAILTPATPPTLAGTGSSTVSYTANGCSGNDVITATTTADNRVLTATTTINIQSAAVGSIQFVSATPTNIALRGTGGAGRPENSTVVFQVLDAASSPRPGATVQFSLNTSVGGITLTPSTAEAVTDANGNAQIVVNAGTVATSVRITAAVVGTSPLISTQSNQLTVTTGIPTEVTFSLAVQCSNVYGWDVDGTIVPVTARLADRFNNPVPDGTAVTFTSEGGAIAAQCTTTTTANESGLCTVNWRSSNPRPVDGRATILAKAIGEESFVDSNGNGSFDVGEAFSDLAEPFRDDNENNAYDTGIGEDFFDFNNDQTRSTADGLFNGVLCNDPARCGGATTRTTGIGESNIIIMSDNDPIVTRTSPVGAISVSRNGSRSVTFWVRDLNGNPLPNGTSVSLSASGGGLSVANPAAISVPCVQPSSVPPPNPMVTSATVFGFTVVAADGDNPGSGTITLTVAVPGQQSFVFAPIDVSVL